MGTSDVYRGTAGWKGPKDQTEAWLADMGDGSATTGGDEQIDDECDDRDPAPEDSAEEQPIDPLLSLLGQVAQKLATVSHVPSSPSTAGPSPSSTIGRRFRGGTLAGRRRAAFSGGIAVAGVYGLTNNESAAAADAGFNLEELLALPPFEQARLLVDAASGLSASIGEAEIREVNANFVWWGIEQESDPSAIDLVKRWVGEYVFQAWLTECGNRLRNGSLDGGSTYTLEQEARSTLEAGLRPIQFPVDGVRSSHFESAIQRLLGMLNRIFWPS